MLIGRQPPRPRSGERQGLVQSLYCSSEALVPREPKCFDQGHTVI